MKRGLPEPTVSFEKSIRYALMFTLNIIFLLVVVGGVLLAAAGFYYDGQGAIAGVIGLVALFIGLIGTIALVYKFLTEVVRHGVEAGMESVPTATASPTPESASPEHTSSEADSSRLTTSQPTSDEIQKRDTTDEHSQ